MDELIRKKDALDALTTYIYNIYKVMEGKTLPMEDCGDAAESVLDELPPVQPTITHEQAIDYLHETGWLQNHDRILTESKIVPPVQPKHGKWIDMPYGPSHTKYMCSECGKMIYTNSEYIKEHKFCFSCGADMRCSENPNS